MDINVVKAAGAVLIAIALVIAIIVDSDNWQWAGPLLTLVVGYVVGNARVTSGDGGFASIVDTTGSE